MSDLNHSERNLDDPDNLYEAAQEQDSEVSENQEGDRAGDPFVEDPAAAGPGSAQAEDGGAAASDLAGETADAPAPDTFAVNDAIDVDVLEEAVPAAVAAVDEDEDAGTGASDGQGAPGEGDAPVEDEPEAQADPYEELRTRLRTEPGKWYVVHTYAGFERRVRDNLYQRIQSMDVSDYIFEIQVPMEDVVVVKNGQRKIVPRVRIPGYVLVRMFLNEDSWSVVRHTPGVTGFVGNAHNPTPLRTKEAFEMLKSTVEVAAETETKGAEGEGTRPKVTEIDFEVGETITIKEGSFEGVTGTISEIKPESGKLTVLLSLFERETPVELSFDQVAKM